MVERSIVIAGRYVGLGPLQPRIYERRGQVSDLGIGLMIGEDDRATMVAGEIDEFGAGEAGMTHLERMA